jgi:hypothetical protein
MPYLKDDIVEQYLAYTYPYTALERLADIREQITLRGIEPSSVIPRVSAICRSITCC